MFISHQTYEGLQTTVYSFIEVCKFLLQRGVPYVLSERFCQDDLENYFGRQRAIGRRRGGLFFRTPLAVSLTVGSISFLSKF